MLIVDGRIYMSAVQPKELEATATCVDWAEVMELFRSPPTFEFAGERWTAWRLRLVVEQEWNVLLSGGVSNALRRPMEVAMELRAWPVL